MLTDLARRLGLRLPIVQAPMAGGATTPDLVAAVSNAGALGSLAAALLPPERIAEQVAEIRRRTDRPFGVNLFVLDPAEPDPAAIARSHELLRPIRRELGLPDPAIPARFAEDFRAQLDAVADMAPPVASFAFGLLDAPSVARLKARGTLVIGTATNMAEAKAWVANGADAVCAQGAEAGGHRGTFMGDVHAGTIGTMTLVRSIARAVDVPVLAAGGLMDGAGIAAALALGAQAAQLGTAFLPCRESGVSPLAKATLREAEDGSTRLTRAFTGRFARGLGNGFMRTLEPHQHEFPAYPVQNWLTGDIRAAAAKAGRTEFMSLWSGQGVARLRERPEGIGAGELVAQLEREMREAARALPPLA